METDAAVISAFDEIFGQALMPLGFVRAKLKQPYYIRLVNNEIIHIIGIRDMKTHLFAFGSVATVYREDLCLNRSYRQNEGWLKSAMDFYARWHASGIEFDPRIQSGFHYQKWINPDYAPEAVQGALDAEDEKYHRSQEVIDKNRAEAEKMYEKSRRRLRLFMENEGIRRQTMEELARRSGCYCGKQPDGLHFPAAAGAGN